MGVAHMSPSPGSNIAASQEARTNKKDGPVDLEGMESRACHLDRTAVGEQV